MVVILVVLVGRVVVAGILAVVVVVVVVFVGSSRASRVICGLRGRGWWGAARAAWWLLRGVPCGRGWPFCYMFGACAVGGKAYIVVVVLIVVCLI